MLHSLPLFLRNSKERPNVQFNCDFFNQNGVSFAFHKSIMVVQLVVMLPYIGGGQTWEVGMMPLFWFDTCGSCDVTMTFIERFRTCQ